MTLTDDVTTYTDPQTGLIWARNGNIIGQELAWGNAMNWVKHLNYGGYCDWRLPTHGELMGFRDRSVICPQDRSWIMPYEWFNANGFDNVQACFYWCSCVYGSDGAWVVAMFDHSAGGNSKNVNNFVWPVRG